ncbi:MAG TPA: ester cyclase [Acidobacteriaceae bacterium]|jgi:steroid delta-isomerase-like uncharacterized protein
MAERRTTVSDENKAIARKLMEEAWNKGRLEVVDELISAGCRFHDSVFPSLTSGAGNYKQHIQTCRTAFPDLKITIEDTIAERNEVVLHWKAHGTHRGPFLGMPPTEKSATISGTSINRIDKGKIAEQWVDWNLLSLMEQLGVAMQSQPAKSKR